MKRRRVRVVIAGLLVALGCTHDYDKFSSPDEPGPNGSGGIAGGEAGASGSGASSGSGGALGSGASLGSAGALGSGASLGSGGGLGSAGLDAGAGAGTGGTNPCGAGEKPCVAGCIRDDDPATGCALASCDPCSSVNSLPVCQAGACAVGSCTSGFEDCAGGAADGCEQDIGAANHCGGCDNDCTAQGAAGGFSCESRRCGCTSDEQCIVGAGLGTATCNTTNRRCVCEAIECRPGEACERQGTGRRCRCSCGGTQCAVGQRCFPGDRCG